MTCQEFVVLCSKHPMKCTRAERAAHYVHYRSCPRCQFGFDSFMEGRDPGSLTAEERRRLEEDREDPEVAAEVEAVNARYGRKAQ
jgi:hypothetical protein